MNAKTATAIAMAVTLITVGLSAMPYAGASQTVTCPSADFQVADSKASAQERDLDPGEVKVGSVSISELEGDHKLTIELTDTGANGELSWNVLEVDGGQCMDITQSACTADSLSTEDEEECLLPSDQVSADDYLIEYRESNEMNTIEFLTFAEEA